MTLPGDESAAGRCTKPFLDHMEDLRKTVVICASLLFGSMLVVIPFVPCVMELLLGRIEVADMGVAFTAPVNQAPPCMNHVILNGLPRLSV